MEQGFGETGEGPRLLRGLLRRATRLLGLLEGREVACCGITLAQCHALQEVAARPGLTVGELAAALGVDASTASRAAESLVGMGAIERLPVPGNRRAVSLTPTPQGESLLASLETQADEHARRLWQALPSEKRGAVLEAARHLLDALEGLGGGCCPPDGAHDTAETVKKGERRHGKGSD